jgi:photosystem II stability/assembly factor-like uncharacterized protein
MRNLLLAIIFLFTVSSQVLSQWIPQNSGTTNRFMTCFFLDDNLGWAAGNLGTIVKTTNGGQNWTSQSISTTDHIHSIFFTDPLNGWLVLYEFVPDRHGSILRTTNGGDSWFTQLTVWGYSLHRLFFSDSNNGYAMGSNGVFYKTINGGQSWNDISPFNSYWLYSAYFFNPSEGWVGGGLEGYLLRTINGGQSWSYIGLPTNERMMSLFFIDENYGWACGAAGKILRTTNYGLDWLLGNSGVNVELRDIKFINQNEGWSVGLNGKIIHTADGGTNWLQQNSGTINNLFGVYFADSLKGWVVGDNGVILKTTNGGGVSTYQTQFEKTYGGINSERGVVIDGTNDGGYVIGGSTASFSSSEDMFLVKLDSTGIIQWTKVYNSFGYDRIHGVKQTTDGGYYLSGYVGDGNGLFDMAIAKIDAIGNIVWSKYSGSVQAEELRKLSLTPDGGLLVAGYNASIGVGSKDVQTMKISSNGTIEWAKTYGTLYEDFNSSCKVASDGNYVLSGALDISGSYDVRPTLIKLDTLGNIIWAKYFQGYIEDWGRDLIETPDGGFLIVGDTKSYGLGGSQDIFLIKTDNSGNVEWAKAIGGIGNEMVHCALLTSDSKCIISGSTNSYGFGSYDAFLLRINLSGDIEWFHTYGGNTGDNGYDVVEGIDQGFALTGGRSSNTLGGDDVWLIKTDVAGFSDCAFGTFNPNVFVISNLQAINLNMGTGSLISAADLTLTTITPNSGQTTSCAIIPVELKSFNYKIEKNNVKLSWTTATEINNQGFKVFRDNNEIGFVAGSGTTTELRNYSFNDENLNSGIYNYALLQNDFDGTSRGVGELTVEVKNIPSDFILEQNYPNPFNPSTTIGYSIPEVSFIKLSVYNSLGEKVADIEEGEKPAGYYEVNFDASTLPTGIYFYALSTGKFTATKKMLLLK